MKIELTTTPEWAAMERKVANAEVMIESYERRLKTLRKYFRRVTERNMYYAKVLHALYEEDEISDEIVFEEWLEEESVKAWGQSVDVDETGDDE